MKTTIAIIGGGAAGLAAALEAARAGARVRVYEANDRVGKSVLATGNGRCNFSNADPFQGDYRNAPFVEEAFRSADSQGLSVLGLFEGLGLAWREESEGRLYPATNKASTVLDVLRAGLAGWGVQEVCVKRAVCLAQDGEGWSVRFEDGSRAFADAVIVAAGGKVSSSLAGSEHPFVAQRAVLGPVKTKTDDIRGLNNIRVRCAVRLLSQGQDRAFEVGEVLFRDYGISGIAVFNLSRFVQKGDFFSLDLLDGLGGVAAAPGELLEHRATAIRDCRSPQSSLSLLDVTEGLLLAPVARCALKASGLDPKAPWGSVSAEAVERALRDFRIEATGAGDAKQCQVHRGGLSVEAFDPATMASRLAPGLYAAGEALDVDAACGGFNLHWAWISGMLAGRNAAAGRNLR